METPELVLYFAPGSSSMAPHVALHEIGVPFQARPVVLAKGETHTPEFLALNPEGKVPTLLIDGRPLTEVAAILFYLARRFPEAGLLATRDLEDEAQAISWMSFLASSVHPARKQGREPATRVFSVAETRLGDREWALGTYSIVDIFLFRLFWRFRGTYPLSPGELPRLSSHYQRTMARPAVQRTCTIEDALRVAAGSLPAA